MNLTALSNYQLYSLLQYRKIEASIKKAVQSELDSRQLSQEQLRELVSSYATRFPMEDRKGLSIENKILLVCLPMFWSLQILWASKYLARNQRRKWKEFWVYICIGYALWTIAGVIITKFVRREG
jgi:hypothetical protein